MKKILLVFFLFSFSLVQGAEKLRVVPVISTSESNQTGLRLIFPRLYENKRKNPINIQMQIKGFPLGIITKNHRSEQIFNHPEKQSIHVIIDNEPYLSYYQPVEGLFDKSNKPYNKIMSFPIPFNLKPGQHVIRAFPVYSYGESLKEKGNFIAEIFYFQDQKKIDSLNIDLTKPYLTYNEPQGRFPVHQSDPILLDFYLSNCELSINSYKVRLSIDGKLIETLTKWTPYYLYGLSKGSHQIQLELVDKNNQVVPGFFNVVYREIIIH